MLDFIQERLQECISDPASRDASLTEASCALRVLKRRLFTEDPARGTQFVLVYDSDPERLKEVDEPELGKAINDLLDSLKFIADLFDQTEPPAC
jgi:hypothetical protein